MSFSVVIPHYNTWHLIQRVVSSLLLYDDAYIQEIIIVDDCSPSINPFSFNSKVRIIYNQTNVGYTATVNNGLKCAKSKYILLLDSDAYLTKPILREIKSQFEKDINIGCIGLNTVNEAGLDTGNEIYQPSVLSLISGQWLHAKLKPFFPYRHRQLIPFSCAVAFKKSMIDELNYFDESFPVLEADHDLSLRILKSANWKISFNNDANVFHVGSGSIKKDGARVKLFHEYRWRLLLKHDLVRFKNLSKYLVVTRVLLEVFVACIASKLLQKERYKNLFKTRLDLLNYIIRKF